jgi:polyisoprenoid-binding protein YceI
MRAGNTVHAAMLARLTCFCQATGMQGTNIHPRSFLPSLLRWRSVHLIVAASRCLIAIACALPSLAAAAPETYRFDPLHTQIWFSGDHEKFSHPLGRLRVKDGWFQFDAKDWSASRVDVLVDLASADMGDAKWSDTMKSGQWLDAARWPAAHFTSRSVEQKDATHGVIHGDLTFHGETRPVDVAFTLNRIGNDPYAFKQKAGFSATATLHRFEFGMTRYKDVVGDAIELHFEIEGIRDDNAAASKSEDH